MFHLPWRQRPAPVAPAPSPDPTPGWPSHSADALLATAGRQALLQQIRRLTSVPDHHWSRLYLTLFNAYAGLVQELPASANHHHAYRGGLLDHGLEVVRHGLTLRQGLVLPAGATPEQIGPTTELYTYAIATGCLLHDIGKLACDQLIEVDGQRWFPWLGPITGNYCFRFIPGRRHQLHQPASLLLAPLLIPPEGLSWLAGDRDVWTTWLLALSGQDSSPLYPIIVQADRASVAGDLGANPQRAAAAPTPPLHSNLLTALRHLLDEGTLALNRKGAAGWLTEDSLWLVSKTVADALRAQLLSEGHEGIPTHNVRLFEVLQEHGLLIPNGQQAIWHGLVDDGHGWQVTLTLLRLAPATVWPTGTPARWQGTVTPQGTEEPPVQEPVQEAAGSPAAGEAWLNPALVADAPAKPAATGNVKDRAPQPPLDDLGTRFLDWIEAGIRTGALIVNDPQALVHTVVGGVFLVTPLIFKVFVRDHPALFKAELLDATALLKTIEQMGKGRPMEPWERVQQAFQRLGLHEKHPLTGENIRRFRVQGPRRESYLQGYWLPDAHGRRVIGSCPTVENPFISLVE